MLTLIVSTLKYLLFFTITLFFFKLSEQEFRYCDLNKKDSILHFSKKKAKGFLFAFIAIIFISIIAGIRAEDVGVDTSGFPKEFMTLARSAGSLSKFIAMESDLSNEPLGAILVYFCSLFTSETWLLLFFYQFFTILPVFYAALLFKDKLSITNSMAIYLFVFFNNSLNMMRQSVGCALILLGLSIMINKKSFIKAGLLFLAAIFFHRASIYGTVFILLIYFSYYLGKKYMKYLIYILILLIPIFMNTFASILSLFTTDSHILYYLDIFIYKKVEKNWFVNPFSLYSIIYLVVIICLLIMPEMFSTNFFRNSAKFNLKNDIESIKVRFMTFNVIGFLMYCSILFSMTTMYGIRFSIFFDYIYTLSIPLSMKFNKSYKKILYTILFACWFVWIMRMGWSGSEIYQIGI